MNVEENSPDESIALTTAAPAERLCNGDGEREDKLCRLPTLVAVEHRTTLHESVAIIEDMFRQFKIADHHKAMYHHVRGEYEPAWEICEDILDRVAGRTPRLLQPPRHPRGRTVSAADGRRPRIAGRTASTRHPSEDNTSEQRVHRVRLLETLHRGTGCVEKESGGPGVVRN